MVVQANKGADGIGGHLSTFASRAALYEVGFNHFFRGKDDGLPGDHVYFQGHAAPGIYARAFLEGRLDRRAPRPLPPRDRRRRAVVLPAPAADARLLGVPDRVDGPRPHQLDLPGPLQQVPAQPARSTTPAARGCGASSATARCDEPETLGSISLAGARAARQPHLGRQLQPPAPRRTGARQRQDHPGARGRLPGRGLERHQGHLGLEVGRAAGTRHRRRAAQQDEHDGRRRVPALRGRDGAYIREHFFGPDPRLRKHGRAPVRRRAAQPPPRRPRLPEALRRLQGRDRARRRADRDPGQDGQGLDARARRRGPQRHPPDQEDDHGPAAALPRPAVPAGRDPRRSAGRRRSRRTSSRATTRRSTST